MSQDRFSCYSGDKNRCSFLENSRDGIYRSTPDGTYLDVNQSLVEMLDYDSKQELMEQNIAEEIYFDKSTRPRPENRNKLYITTLRQKDGTPLQVEINSWVVRDDRGQVCYEGIVRDLSERLDLQKELYNTREQLKLTLKSIGDGVIVTDREGRVKLMNQQAEDLTGYRQDRVEGRPLTEIFKIINEHTRRPVANPVEKVLETGQTEGLANHTILINKEGEERAIADSAAPITGPDGTRYGVIMVFRDVTEKRQMLSRIRDAEERYRTLFENTGTAMGVVEPDCSFSMVNQQLEVLTGYTREELIEEMTWKDLVAREEKKQQMLEYHQQRRQAKLDQEIPRRYEFKLETKNGKIKDILITVSLFPQGKQSIISLIDITERKQMEEKARYLGYHDQLTGLYNRTYFEETLERLDTKRQLPISIIMGDVNGLKLVNDAFGHDLGDRLLVRIARLLDNCCRQEDIVARWGGDEFVILLPRTGRQAARRIINRINRACEKAGDDPIQPSISLGFITKEEESSDIWNKLKTAEKWMYKHKLLESESARSSIISSLEETLWEKDYETKEHARRIKNMALKMGQALDLPENKLDELVLLAGLHDIGKIAISDSILLKPDSFTEKEWEDMKKHPEIGYRIAQASSELAPVAEGILHHHEWWDGSGYPHGLSGEDIPLTSRIICIVDAFDVMVHERPYKQPIRVEEALVELKRCAGQQFDPELVRVFEKEVYPHLHQLEDIDLDGESTNLQTEEERL